MGKCIFVVFQNFFRFNWRVKSVIFLSLSLSLSLSKQLRYANYSVETYFSYLGSIKHIYIYG